MVTRPACWPVALLTSLLACTWTWRALTETQRQISRLQWKLGMARIEETTLQHRLDEERVQHARGLVAALHRPVTSELVTVLRRIPSDVRVSDLIVTAHEWQMTGRHEDETDAEPVVTLRFMRSDVEQRE